MRACIKFKESPFIANPLTSFFHRHWDKRTPVHQDVWKKQKTNKLHSEKYNVLNDRFHIPTHPFGFNTVMFSSVFTGLNAILVTRVLRFISSTKQENKSGKVSRAARTRSTDFHSCSSSEGWEWKSPGSSLFLVQRSRQLKDSPGVGRGWRGVGFWGREPGVYNCMYMLHFPPLADGSGGVQLYMFYLAPMVNVKIW